ncbi:glycoside hydrolase family 42 [Opitutaceae bacterium TAV5]|nr:glycoside hydrolase family 42 [Opitutaceae bacterium TAV5]
MSDPFRHPSAPASGFVFSRPALPALAFFLLAGVAVPAAAQVAAVQDIDANARSAPAPGEPRSVNIAETLTLAEYDPAAAAALPLRLSRGVSQKITAPTLARPDVSRVHKITTDGKWAILYLPGEYPIEGATLTLDYYVPEHSALRSFTTNEKQRYKATRAIGKGRWTRVSIDFADMVGGDLWRLQSLRSITDPTLTFTSGGGIDVEIARLAITRRPAMPLPVPRVIRSRHPEAPQVFTREIEIGAVDADAWCQLMADGDFVLTVNGREAGRGGDNAVDTARWPSGGRFMALAKEIPVGEYLVPGRNLLRVAITSQTLAPELVLAFGWQEGDHRHVVVSDASWATVVPSGGGAPVEDLGSLPAKEAGRFNRAVDIFPLLVPRPWDTRNYVAAPLADFPPVEHTAAALRPRIVPGAWSARNLGPRWSLVDPAGAPFFLLAAQTDMILPRWAYRYSKHLYNTWETEAAWAAHDVAAMRRLGFNTLAVSLHAAHYQHGETLGMPSFRNLDIAMRAGGPRLRANDGRQSKMPDPFDPTWRANLTAYLEKTAAEWKDQAVTGVFIDNELDLDGALHCASITGDAFSDAAGKKFVTWLRTRYRTIDDLNRAWFGSAAHAAANEPSKKLAGFDDILVKKPAPPREKSTGLNHTKKSPAAGAPAMERDYYDFAMLTVKEFADCVLAEVRRTMPGKLVASNRFMGGATAEVLAAWKDYDIIAWNAYPMDRWDTGEYTDIQLDRMKLAHRVTGKPVIVTEFGIQSLDSGVPSPTAKLATQKRRGEEYGKILDQLLRECPFIVGLVPFGWMDSTEGERANWGMVSPDGQPYRDYLEGLAAAHRKLDRTLGPDLIAK